MKRGASQTLHRIGETEARSSTGWPGSPSTRPLRPQGRPAREGLGPRAGPRLASPPRPPPPPWPPARGECRTKDVGAGPGGWGRGGGYKGRRPARPSRPSSPGADGLGRPAPRRGPARPPAPAAAAAAAAAPAAAAVGPGPAVAGECPPPAGHPPPRGAGHAGWARWPSWTHGDARGGPARPVTRKAVWVPGGVIDSELPVPGGVQVEPAPGSLRLVSGTPHPPPSSGTCSSAARPRYWGVCWGRYSGSGYRAPYSLQGQSPAGLRLASASRCVASVSTPPGWRVKEALGRAAGAGEMGSEPGGGATAWHLRVVILGSVEPGGSMSVRASVCYMSWVRKKGPRAGSRDPQRAGRRVRQGRERKV